MVEVGFSLVPGNCAVSWLCPCHGKCLMNTLDQQYRIVLTFLTVTILAGGGYWIVKHFHPTLFLGEPDFIVGVEEDAPQSIQAPQPQQPEIVVHVVGAVKSPGVYRLASGVRVQDAIERAGGSTDEADIHRLNLALPIRDGQQIYVPKLSETEVPSVVDAQRPASGVAGPSLDASHINLNTATSEELQRLPRIGPVMAGRIIAYRQTHGRFSSVDELADVSGIGGKTLEQIRPLVVVY